MNWSHCSSEKSSCLIVAISKGEEVMSFSEGRGLYPTTKWPQMDVVSTPCDKAVQISANVSELRTTLPRRWKIFIDHTQNPSPKVDTGGKCR